MHDPNTVAFTIQSPFRKQVGTDPIGKPRYYRNPLLTIWHRDACRPGHGGSDDTCGFFMRAGHGDEKVLEAIIRDYDFDWDRTYKPSRADHDNDDGPYDDAELYYSGFFRPEDGKPVLSPMGITINLFYTAAFHHFGQDSRKARRYIQRHLADILLFAENPTDSIYDTLTRKFSRGEELKMTPYRRKERIASLAATVYAFILRSGRPWYKHPRWHVVHWRQSKRKVFGRTWPVPFRGWYFQLHPWQTLRRWLFDRCARCGKGFAWGESPTTFQWNSPPPRFCRSQTGIYHGDCAGSVACSQAPVKPGC